MMSNKNKLIDKILNEQNIFSAIFSMESYVFDIGLLETEMPVFLINEEGVDGDIIANNDLELYYALADKHNVELIEKVIDTCQRRMKWLFEDKENLFEARVYFKFKNYDEGRLKFRPMHTARLIDLICMVSILNCLMFDDDSKKERGNCLTYQSFCLIISMAIYLVQMFNSFFISGRRNIRNTRKK